MSEAIHHARTEKLLLEAARRFNAILDYEELIRQVLELVIAAVDAEAALVFRVDHKRSDIKIRFMDDRNRRMKVFHRDIGQGVVGGVPMFHAPVIMNVAARVSRIDREIERQGGVEIRSLITVPLIGKGQMIGVIEAINKATGPFTEADLDVLIGLANQIAVAIDNAALYRAVKREALERTLLYEVGKKLSGSLTLDEVLKDILDSLKQVVDYDAAGVFLVEPDRGEIGSIYTVGYDTTDSSDMQLKIGQGLIGNVVKAGEPIIVADVMNDDRYVNARAATRSEIVVPMILGNQVIGVVNLESDRVGAYDQEHVALLSAFASQAAISVERARMHERLLSSERLEQQLSIAREIQRSFLPPADPVLPGYDLAGRNISSEQVGGDYYDFICIVQHHTGIAIGDVSGKGIPAALIMASFRSSLIAEIRNNYSIGTICRKVNNLMCESLKPGNFVTAVYGVLDSKNHIFTFANCGHDQPIWLHSDGRVELLREGGLAFGITRDAVYEERPLFLNSGDIVVFYTDGVTEVFDRNGQQFGTKRLIEILHENRHRPAGEILDEVYRAVKNYASPDHVFDDFTMIVLKRL